MKKFLKLLLGTGLLIFNHPDRVKKTVIDPAGDHLDDLRDLAQEKYQTVADIVASTFHHYRDEDSHALRNALRLAAGVGIGVGLGLLFAPASGQETRSLLAEKAQGLAGMVQKQ